MRKNLFTSIRLFLAYSMYVRFVRVKDSAQSIQTNKKRDILLSRLNLTKNSCLKFDIFLCTANKTVVKKIAASVTIEDLSAG